MLTKIEIFELGETSPIISLTNSTHVDSSVEDESKDFNKDGDTDDIGENYKRIKIWGNILLGNTKENPNKIESQMLYKESLEVKSLINWAMLPADDLKCYKTIRITTKADEYAEENTEAFIEYAYISEYKESYDQVVGVNSGLLPFSIVIKELIKIDEMIIVAPPVGLSKQDTTNENSQDEIRYINKEYAALFEEPSTRSKVKIVIKYGEKLKLVSNEKKKQDEFMLIKVTYGDLLGWIDCNYLGTKNLEGVEYSGKPTEEEMKVSADKLNLREKPDTDSISLKSLTRNSVVNIDGCDVIKSDDHDWIRVEYNGLSGWVAKEFIKSIIVQKTNTKYGSPYGNIKAKITSPYGYRCPKSTPEYHLGFDMCVAENTPLYALGNGVVTMKRKSDSYGYMVFIKYDDTNIGTFTSFYAHMSKQCDEIAEDDIVTKDTIVGYEGGTPNYSSHLHWECYYGSVANNFDRDNRLNPLKILYGIEMNREAINSSGYFKYNDSTDAYSYNARFLKLTESQRGKFNDDEIINDIKSFMGV